MRNRGFNWFKGTIAQAIIICFLIYVICAVMAMFNSFTGGSTAMGLISFFSNLPLFEAWLSIWSAYTLGSSAPEAFLSLTAMAYAHAFAEAMIASIAVHIANVFYTRASEADEARIFGANLLPCFLGVLAATFLIWLMNLGNDTTALIMEIGVIVTIIVGLRIMFTGRIQISIFPISAILSFFIDSLLAVITCGYITKITMIITGNFASVGQALRDLLICSVCLLVAAVLSYIATGRPENT